MTSSDESPPDWTVVETEQLQDCKVFTVSRALTRSPQDSAVYPFFRIDAADWVNVIPLTPEGDVVMVRQYRHGSGRITLEIPGGIVDPGETPQTAAAREMLEETGYRSPSEVTPLGTVNPNPALFGNTCHTFLARDVEQVGEIQNSGTEHTMVEVVPRADLPQRLHCGDVDHSLVITALYWLMLEETGRGR